MFFGGLFFGLLCQGLNLLSTPLHCDLRRGPMRRSRPFCCKLLGRNLLVRGSLGLAFRPCLGFLLCLLFRRRRKTLLYICLTSLFLLLIVFLLLRLVGKFRLSYEAGCIMRDGYGVFFSCFLLFLVLLILGHKPWFGR